MSLREWSVRGVLFGLGLLLAAASVAGAALIVLPAPSKTLALAAIVASERSLFLVGGGCLAVFLVLAARGPTTRLPAIIAALLSISAISVAIVPPLQAWRLARAEGVSLDLRRYLGAGIDTEGPGAPDRTVTYATVGGAARGSPRDGSPAGERRDLSLDVYLPPGRPATPGRAILMVHGGFWSAGQKGEAALASRRLASFGFTVFDADYRLAPQPNWSTAVGDVKCAIGWIKAHAETPDWNVDRTRLAVLGRSAGGHLALIAAYTAGYPDLPPSCEVDDTSVEAVIALYAPTDLVWGYEHPANPRVADSRARLRAFLGDPPDAAPDRWRALSPTERARPGVPRTLIVQGGRDQFVLPENMDILATRLRHQALGLQTLFIPYGQHGFDFVIGGFSSQLLEAALLRFLGSPQP